MNRTNKNQVIRSRVTVVLQVCMAIGFAPVAATGAPWDFGVDIELGVIRSDNIFLAVDGMEESETIYTIAPEFFLTTDSDRIDANIRYRPEAYFYDQYSDADNIYHVVDATMTGALVRDRVFLYLGASNFQSIILPEFEFPTSNVPISNNRIDSRTLEARPYWQQSLGNADLMLELSYIDVKYDDELIQSNNARTAKFSLDNIASQQGLAWGLNYEYRRMEYDMSVPWEFQRAALDLGFWVSGNARLFVVGGAETAIDNIFEANMDSELWEAGLQYKPNSRLNIEAAAGDRSYGTSFRLDLSYTLRRGETSLTYNEGPGTRGQLSVGRRPIEDTDNIDNILDRPGRSDRFLTRRGEWQTNINLSKSQFTLRVFAESREQRDPE